MDPEKQMGKSRLDKNLIGAILERIGHQEVVAPRQRKNKVLPRIAKEKSYLTKRAIDPAVVSALEDHEFRINEIDQFHTYKSRLDALKPERLFVPDPSHLPGKSITTHIDPEFYTIVAGRAIKDKEKLADYRWAIRSCFLARLKSSKIDEEKVVIEREKSLGNAAFEYAYEALCVQADSFNKFLEDDYRKSAEFLEEAEAAARRSLEQEAEMRELQEELEFMQSKVLRLDEQWRWYQTLQQFLFSISPLQWSTENNSDKLYFDDPKQLAEVFAKLEDRNLGYLVQCEKLQPAVITMEKSYHDELAVNEANYSALAEDVAELREAVAKKLKEMNELKKQVDTLCKTEIHSLVCDKRTIVLTACLEDAYERVVGPKDSGMSALEMMRAVEATHENLRLQLDLLPTDLVRRITAAWEREQKRIMNEARVAAKKVHQMNMLEKRFRNAVKLATPKVKRRLVERSKPPRDVKKAQKQLQELTVEEEEQKYFFEFATSEDNPDLMYRPMC